MMIETGNTLQQRVTFVNWILPILLVLLFAVYQFGISYGVNAGMPAVADAVTLIYALSIPLLVFWTFRLINQWFDEDKRKNNHIPSTKFHATSIINSAADAILSLNADGRIEFWNPSAEMLFGFMADEIIGQPMAALLGKNASAEVEARWLIDTVVREGYVRRHETTCRDASGRAVFIELSASFFPDEFDKAAGFSIILRDITTRRRREEENRHLTARLNQQAEEKTYELAEKVRQLAQVNTELFQLDETRSEFVSLVAHQIRAPLTNMDGAVQRIKADCGVINPTCSRMFVIMEQQFSRLDRLVQDVLSATRIEAGEITFHCEPVSMLPIVLQAKEQFHTRMKSRTIHLTEKPGLPLVYADRDRISEILINLLDNADKYSSPEEEILIDVRADQSEVTVSVRDSGLGVAPKDLERVFDKFYRADSTDSQVSYGYGLGLYVCRRLVEAQNGRIWAENHPVKGAIFSFALPVWQG